MELALGHSARRLAPRRLAVRAAVRNEATAELTAIRVKRRRAERELEAALRQVHAAGLSLSTARSCPRAAAGELEARQTYLDRAEREYGRCIEAVRALRLLEDRVQFDSAGAQHAPA